jgi:hypothetical protein
LALASLASTPTREPRRLDNCWGGRSARYSVADRSRRRLSSLIKRLVVHESELERETARQYVQANFVSITEVVS